MKTWRYILLIFFLIISNFGYSIILQKPQNDNNYLYSGDNQTQIVGEDIDKPIRVLVTNNEGVPMPNHKLVFTCISYPKHSTGFKLEEAIVYTDSTGIAINHFKLGNKEGVYEILVSSLSDHYATPLVYKLTAKRSTWIIFLIIGLLGGLSLFLYGMDLLSKGMQATAGKRIRNIISRFTTNRFLALFAGLFITVIVQSSSATTVMLVGFVEAGLMNFVQTLGMLLGAGIGTTITAQLIALKLTDYALLIVSIGFGFIIFTKNGKFKNIGKSILGFGILFFGMFIMSEAMSPLRTYSYFLELLIKLENPWLGVLVGFVFTALIQSSAAFIGIMITIASQGFLSLEACIPLVLGTNIGTGVTAILASLNSGRDAKRVAFAHTFFKIIGVLIFMWWIPYYADFVRYISPHAVDNINSAENISTYVPRQIANAHLIFSIGLTLILLPFLNILSKLILKIIPDKPNKETNEYKLKYINPVIISSPELSLSLAKKETERMSHKVQKLLNISLQPFLEKDKSYLEKWQNLENEIDFLKENINNYLISVSTQNSDKENFSDAYQIMYVTKELEMIADIVNTNMRRQCKKWLDADLEFSDEGKKELETMLEKSLKQLSRSMEVFNDLNLEKIAHIKNKFKKYAKLAEDYEVYHYERLVSNNETSKGSSQTHLELLNLLKATNRHATNISRILLNPHYSELTINH